MAETDATHDPQRRSFVAAANRPGADFPLQNLPLGVFQRPGDTPRGGIAIGDHILDLAAASDAGLFSGGAAVAAEAAREPALNALMALGHGPAAALRAQAFDLLEAAGAGRGGACLVPMADVTMHLPARIGDFTDFLTSSFHSSRLSPAGKPGDNFHTLPIAYHSRASSVRPSGSTAVHSTAVHSTAVPGTVVRPHGQWRDETGAMRFGPTEQFDYELELGAFIGPGNALGEPIGIDAAPDQLFGYCLLNDWSVRDVQRWESAPLGPFQAKSVGTTISPWVVTAAALLPFQAAAFPRGDGEPAPMPHLASARQAASGGLDLQLYADLLTPQMRAAGAGPERLTDTNFVHMYWTFAQMVTHHASNGCDLRPGDLLGSGTASGPTDASRACLAEINARGTKSFTLANGERRMWLEDGDEVIFQARAERAGFVSIGFGECRATVAPAVTWPAPG